MSLSTPVTMQTPHSTLIIIGVCGGLLTLFFLGCAVAAHLTHETGAWAIAAIALAPAILAAWAIASCKAWRATLDSYGVRQQTLKGERAIALTDIRGFRMARMAVVLEHLHEPRSSLRLSPEILTNADFKSWLQSIPDLDAEDAERLRDDLEQRFGVQSEVFRRISIGATILSGVLSTWLYVTRDNLAVLVTMMIPLVAIALATLRRGAFTFEENFNDNQTRRLYSGDRFRWPPYSLAFAWIMPALCVTAAQLRAIFAPSFSRTDLLLAALLAAGALSAILALDPRIRTPFFAAVFFLILLGWAAGTVAALTVHP